MTVSQFLKVGLAFPFFVNGAMAIDWAAIGFSCARQATMQRRDHD